MKSPPRPILPRLALLCIALLIAQLVFASHATAATTCTASSTNLAFGPVASGGNTDASATITVTCNTTAFLAVTYVTACLDMGPGSGGSGGMRTMLNGYLDPLAFEVYEDAARSNVWGGTSYVPPAVQFTMSYSGFFGGSGTSTQTFYGRIPAQTGIAAGTYQSVFNGGHARLSYQYREAFLGGGSPPASCTTGGDGGSSAGSFPFNVTATVPDRCVLGIATDLDFGSVPGLITANRDQTSSISVTCTRRTPWQIGLDNGQNASGLQRRMRSGGGNFVRYELYRDASRTQRWGNTLNSDTTLGTGSGTAQAVAVHGRVPSPQSVAAGNYSDTITVTVTY